MQQLEAVATAEEAVCGFIDQLGQDIAEFVDQLDYRLATASRQNALPEATLKLCYYLKFKLAQCESVCATHHDLLEEKGLGRHLFKLTEVQDNIHLCLQTMELLIEVCQ